MTDSGRFSIIPARAFDDTRLGAAPLKLLGLLGCYANRDGWCWPSIATLAKRMGVESRQAIQKHLSVLVTTGYIKRQRQDGGVNRYRILHDVDLAPEFDRMHDAEPANVSVAPPRHRDVASDRGVPPKSWQGGQPDVGIELTHRTNPKNEPSLKVSKETIAKPHRGSKRKRGFSFPDNFELTAEMIEYAEKQTPGVDVQADFERFRCNALAKGLKYVDWKMAWYTWCRSPYGKPMNGGQHERTGQIRSGPAQPGDRYKGPASFVEATRQVLAARAGKP